LFAGQSRWCRLTKALRSTGCDISWPNLSMRPPASPGRGAGLPRRAEGDPTGPCASPSPTHAWCWMKRRPTSPSAVSAAPSDRARGARSGAGGPVPALPRHLRPMQPDQVAGRLAPDHQDDAGHHRQPAAAAWHLSRPTRPCGPQHGERARADPDALGFPAPPTAQQPDCARSGQGTLSF